MPQIVITAIFLGIGLAMDACAVSMANGLNNQKMKINISFVIAITFGIFQGLMPLIGYFLGSALLLKINWIIPILALLILGFLGTKMLIDGIKNENEDKMEKFSIKLLFVQAIATSIDALSVGFTIADYKLIDAIVTSIIVVAATFIICLTGVYIGKKVGTKLGNKAIIFGGIILIAIGIEIFISGMFF